MVPLIFSTIISCSDAIAIFNRLTSVVGLTQKQKMEIIMELKKAIPSCPVVINKNGNKQ